MREVNVSIITDNIKEMCIEANHFLTDDMKNVFEKAVKNEESAHGKQVLGGYDTYMPGYRNGSSIH